MRRWNVKHTPWPVGPGNTEPVPVLALSLVGTPAAGPWSVLATSSVEAVTSVAWNVDGAYYRTDTTAPYYLVDDNGATATFGTGSHRIFAEGFNSVNQSVGGRYLDVWEGAGPSAAAYSPLFPVMAIWNRRCDAQPLHASNATWMDVINGHTGHNLHQEWGSALYQGRYVGIPVNVFALSGYASKTITLTTYAGESDAASPMTLKIPDAVLIEGDPDVFDSAQDNHLVLFDTETSRLHEFFGTERNAPVAGQYTAKQYSTWDTTSYALRTDTWTSADAAGLPIAPLQLRYDEAIYAVWANGVVPHALRLTLNLTHGPYLWPARHNADTGGVLNPPFGMRVRLKSSYLISDQQWSPMNRVILRTLQQYGAYLADNGGDWFITGDYDTRWNDIDLNVLRTIIPDGNFEVVDDSGRQVDANSAQSTT